MEHGTLFQHVSTFQELLPQLHDGERNLLAFSMLQIHESDIKSITDSLLQKITILTPLPTNPELLQKMKLRLDSRQVQISLLKVPHNLTETIYSLYLYEQTLNGTMVLHEAYGIKGNKWRLSFRSIVP